MLIRVYNTSFPTTAIFINMIRLKPLMSEQDTKKITVDISDVDKYCQVLRLTKADADNIITANKEAYSKIIDTQFASLERDLLDIDAGYGYKASPIFLTTYRKEINVVVGPAKSLIHAEMNKYYMQLIYASCGLNKPVDISPLAIGISNILFNALIKNYEASFVWKRLAATYVDKNNVEKIKQTAAKIVLDASTSIAYFIHDVFNEFIVLGPVEKYIEQKEKTSPVCDTVVIVRDKNYNPVKPYSPRKTYINYDFMNNLRPALVRGPVVRLVSPRIDAILDGLV